MRLTTNKGPTELTREYAQAILDNPMTIYQRFGQWVCNTYLAEGETWPELFHADASMAVSFIAVEQMGEDA